MDLIKEIVSRAQANKQRIVLPEGTEERTLKAANMILTDESLQNLQGILRTVSCSTI